MPSSTTLELPTRFPHVTGYNSAFVSSSDTNLISSRGITKSKPTSNYGIGTNSAVVKIDPSFDSRVKSNKPVKTDLPRPIAIMQQQQQIEQQKKMPLQKPVFFPIKLHDIISDKSNHDLVRWLPGGKAFLIANKKGFADNILSKRFNPPSQFSSFTRKLTRWRFTRIPRGPLLGAYYHEYFVEGNRELCYRMGASKKNYNLALEMDKDGTSPSPTPSLSLPPLANPPLSTTSFPTQSPCIAPRNDNPSLTSVPSTFPPTNASQKYKSHLLRDILQLQNPPSNAAPATAAAPPQPPNPVLAPTGPSINDSALNYHNSLEQITRLRSILELQNTLKFNAVANTLQDRMNTLADFNAVIQNNQMFLNDTSISNVVNRNDNTTTKPIAAPSIQYRGASKLSSTGPVVKDNHLSNNNLNSSSGHRITSSNMYPLGSFSNNIDNIDTSLRVQYLLLQQQQQQYQARQQQIPSNFVDLVNLIKHNTR